MQSNVCCTCAMQFNGTCETRFYAHVLCIHKMKLLHFPNNRGGGHRRQAAGTTTMRRRKRLHQLKTKQKTLPILLLLLLRHRLSHFRWYYSGRFNGFLAKLNLKSTYFITKLNVRICKINLACLLVSELCSVSRPHSFPPQRRGFHVDICMCKYSMMTLFDWGQFLHVHIIRFEKHTKHGAFVLFVCWLLVCRVDKERFTAKLRSLTRFVICTHGRT